jgi:adenosylcobinamide hydrolase
MDIDFLWQEYHQWMDQAQNDPKVCLSKKDFLEYIGSMDHEDKIVVAGSLYIHLLDQYRWNLLKAAEVDEAANGILNDLGKYLGSKEDQNILKSQNGNLLQDMLKAFARVIVANIQ